MDPALQQNISELFETLISIIAALVVAPFLAIAIIIWFVTRPTREEKMRSLFKNELAQHSFPRLSQRAAIRKISQEWEELVSAQCRRRGRFISYEKVMSSIKNIENICQEHDLPKEIPKRYIDACLALTDTSENNNLHLKLATAFSK